MKKLIKKVFILFLVTIIITTFYGQFEGLAAVSLKIISTKPNLTNRVINDDEDILVVFNQRVQEAAKFKDIALRDINNINVPILCKLNGDNLTIDPVNKLNQGGYYTLTVPYNSIKTETGESLSENLTLVVIVAGDFTSPTIQTVKPENGNRDVDINSLMTIKFSERIRAEANISNIEILYGNNKRVPIYIGISGDTLTIKPLKALEYGTSYFLVIPQNSVGDYSGNGLSNSDLIYFTTKTEANSLAVVSTKPANNAKYIQINEPIQINYNENIVADSGLESIVVKDSNGKIPVGFSINNKTLYIFPKNSLNLAYNTTYNVSIPGNAVKGINGATSKTTYSFDFTTDSQMQNPKIIEANPQNGVLDSNVRSNIKVTFSENIWATETIKSIIIKDERDKIIPYEVSISNDTMTIEPTIMLEYNTRYKYTIPYGVVVNNLGVPLKQEYEFEFKTNIEKFPPVIEKTYPQNKAVNTTVDGGVTIIFSEEVKKGDNFDYITLRDNNYNEIPVIRELKDKTLKLSPVNNLNLDYNTKFLVTVPYGSVKDIWNNQYEATSSFSFTTGYERFSPIVKSSTPSNGSKDSSIKPQLEVVFNDDILKGDNFDKIGLTDNDGAIIKYEAIIVGDKLTIKPQANLLNSTQYSLVIPVGAITDKWGGTAKDNYTINFTTVGEKIPPIVKAIFPVSGSKNVEINNVFTITFSENVIKSKNFNKLSLQNGSQKNLPVTTEIIGNKLVIKPTKPLEEDNNYTLRIPQDGLTDKSLNQLKTDVIINLSTKVSTANKDALTVAAVKYLPSSNEIYISFSKNITYGTGIKKLLLKVSSGKIIATSVALKSNTITLKLKTPLAVGNRYTLVIPTTAVKDPQAKNLLNPYSYSFIR